MAVARMRTHFNERNDAHRHALDVSVLGKKKKGEREKREGGRTEGLGLRPRICASSPYAVHGLAMQTRKRREKVSQEETRG